MKAVSTHRRGSSAAMRSARAWWAAMHGRGYHGRARHDEHTVRPVKGVLVDFFRCRGCKRWTTWECGGDGPGVEAFLCDPCANRHAKGTS